MLILLNLWDTLAKYTMSGVLAYKLHRNLLESSGQKVHVIEVTHVQSGAAPPEGGGWKLALQMFGSIRRRD
eukprot:s3250_g10.t1